MTRKITGIWLDSQGFTHDVIYQRGKKHQPHEGPYPYAKLIYNPEGKYCSHAHYDKAGILIQIAGMKRVGA